MLKSLYAKSATTFCALAVAGCFLSIGAPDASAQAVLRPLKQQRKQERAQKRAERQGGNKLTPGADSTSTNQSDSTTPVDSARAPKHSLDGVSKAGIREFFSKDERQMAIPGFGRPTAFLVILRELDLTEEQKQNIKALRQRVGNQLVILRQQHIILENQLEEALYGEAFDPKRVEELSAQAGGKQAEIIKMQASIESQMRQVLTPDQFYVFRFLVGEMLLPQRRQQIRPQQMQRRMGQPVNPQNPPLGTPDQN